MGSLGRSRRAEDGSERSNLVEIKRSNQKTEGVD